MKQKFCFAVGLVFIIRQAEGIESPMVNLR